jgi:hypothetical protein
VLISVALMKQLSIVASVSPDGILMKAFKKRVVFFVMGIITHSENESTFGNFAYVITYL